MIYKLKNLVHVSLVVICMAAGSISRANANGPIETYPLVKTAEISDVFKTNVAGQNVFTQKFKDIHYVRFAHQKPVELTITISEQVKDWEISPKTNIKEQQMKGNVLHLVLEKPGYHVITINKKQRLFLLTDSIVKKVAVGKANPDVVSIMNYKVDATGSNLSTVAIQKALDETAAKKKILFFPAGIYKTGSIKVSSNARIYLAGGAMIKGSEKREDYPSDDNKKESDLVNDKANFTDNGEWMTFSRLLLIDNATNVKIWGDGCIDGSGSIVRALGKPANLIRIRNSKNVVIEGIELRDPACWNTHILKSENVTLRHIKMLNDRNVANTDGFDPDASINVMIDHCFAYCSDDNIAIKTTNNGGLLQDCENITIQNSVFITKKSALKVGTETKGGLMRNITFKNNYVIEADRGMVLYCYDGATFENINFINNYFEKGYQSSNLKSIHFQIKDRSGKGQIKNVLIKDCTITPTFSNVSEITGLDANHIIDGIKFKNLKVDGKVCLSTSQLGLKTNDFVKNISFEE